MVWAHKSCCCFYREYQYLYQISYQSSQLCSSYFTKKKKNAPLEQMFIFSFFILIKILPLGCIYPSWITNTKVMNHMVFHIIVHSGARMVLVSIHQLKRTYCTKFWLCFTDQTLIAGLYLHCITPEFQLPPYLPIQLTN